MRTKQITASLRKSRTRKRAGGVKAAAAASIASEALDAAKRLPQ
jgi:hypothetical protein